MKKKDLLEAPVGTYWFSKIRLRFGGYYNYIKKKYVQPEPTRGILVKIKKTIFIFKGDNGIIIRYTMKQIYNQSTRFFFRTGELKPLTTKGYKARRDVYESICKLYEVDIPVIPIKRVLRFSII